MKNLSQAKLLLFGSSAQKESFLQASAWTLRKNEEKRSCRDF